MGTDAKNIHRDTHTHTPIPDPTSYHRFWPNVIEM
jgi:hypothetical protein